MCLKCTGKIIELLTIAILISILCCLPVSADQQQALLAEETMLMFVGEEQPVVTVASRYPESPTTAPALVRVVDREQIERHGYRTLAELLSDQPGFYLAAGGRGTVPYLRGLRDSVLFLYDGVPMTTDVTKSFAALDREISLVAVERVEIVRGAGSVLWGADAFAGVVNIVPRRGRQTSVIEARLEAGTQDLRGASLTWGQAQQGWDAFFAFSGTQEQFYDPDLFVDPQQTQPASLDSSNWSELVGTLNVGDWLHLSGRWSDFNRHYTMQNPLGDIRWAGTKDAPVRFIKATVNKIYGPSHYSLSGFFQEADYQVLDADVERQQRNRVAQIELLWDRRIISRGLVTLGASWRRNSVDGALVRDGFLPDFLAPEEEFFVPQIEQKDFTTRRFSLFSQFRYQWGATEWWAGLRLDDNSQYPRTLSYSIGLRRPFGKQFHFKMVYGNAFRSPYSSQLFDNQQFEPESVQTANAQLTWNSQAGHLLELTLFYSSLKDHRAEDPYAGLSLPAERQIYGAELVAQALLSSSLTLNAAATVLGDDDGQEQYRVLAFSILRPDGSKLDFFDEWDEPFDQGPNWLASLNLNWQISDDKNLTIGGRGGGRYDYSYDKGSIEGSYSSPLLIDISYRQTRLLFDRDSVTLRATNLLDRKYLQPDVYGPIEGPPLQLSLVWVLSY